MTKQPERPENRPALNFQPINEGLGFHPFSDGLPYAPLTKSPTQAQTSGRATQGTGAIAAGPPRFARPQATIASPARVSVPVAPQALPIAQSQPQPDSPSRLLRQGAAQAQVTPASEARLALGLQPDYGFTYLLKRAVAYGIDTLFNLTLCVGTLSLALWRQDLSPELLLNPGIVMVAILFLVVFNWAITTAQEVAFGTSVGKRMFGLALNGSTSAIFIRAFFFLPSVCFGGIGLLWALFDRRKRCWHDIVVDLQPIELARF